MEYAARVGRGWFGVSCFNCGDRGPLHNHHVVPKSKGGIATVPLCERCHGLVHGRSFLNHGELTKAALDARKREGKPISGPTIPVETKLLIEGMKASGMSLGAIARELNRRGVPTARGGVQWYPSTVKSGLGYKRPSRNRVVEQ